MSANLGDFEQLVLLALVRLGSGAYGVSVRQEVEDRTGRDVSLGAIYKTLDRLAAKGLVSSWLGEPTAQRGGRRKRHYRVEAGGEAALRNALRDLRAMTSDLAQRWRGP
jgi:DNA-binding PadR family transcriptional regulator